MKYLPTVTYAQPSTGWKFQHNSQQSSYSCCRDFAEEQNHPKCTQLPGAEPRECAFQTVHPKEPPGAKRSCRLSLYLEVEYHTTDENRTGSQNLLIFLNSQRAGGMGVLINLISHALQILCSVLPRKLPPNQDYNSKLSPCPNIRLL